MRSSRYEARGKFGEHERCVRVARGVAESNSSFLTQEARVSILSSFSNSSFLTQEARVALGYASSNSYASFVLSNWRIGSIGSYVSVRSSRYEARGKFGEHERCVRVRGVAENNSRFLSDVLNIAVWRSLENTKDA